MAKVLVVDDESQTLALLGQGLSREGHQVVLVRSGQDALARAAVEPPDLVVIEVELPDLDGVEVVRRLRTWSRVPIVMLSRCREQATVSALDAGADAVVEKPFSIEEMRARVRATLRRGASGMGRAAGRPVRFGDLSIDLEARCVLVGDEQVRLTPLEWRLLETLVRNPGKLLGHRAIIASVWGGSHGDEARASLRVHMRALRQKLGDDAVQQWLIVTEPGAGYRWVGNADPG